jgi:hypothetical protein
MSNWLDFPSGLGPNEYWFIVVTATVTAVIAFVAGLLWLRRAWVIEDTPTSMIRSAAQGYVELQGEAMIMTGTPIVAPLSFLPCAWYRYSVEKRVSDDDQDKLAGSWCTIENGVSDGLFLLRDGTGDCVVDPEGAVVTPAENLLWYGDSRIPPPGPGVPRMWALGSTYRFREERSASATISTPSAIYVLCAAIPMHPPMPRRHATCSPLGSAIRRVCVPVSTPTKTVSSTKMSGSKCGAPQSGK